MLRPILLATLTLCWAIAPSYAADMSGSADSIVDGDTLWVCDFGECHKIRICGINAPERGKPGYERSAEELKRLVSGRSIRCVRVGNGTPCDGRSKATTRDRIVAQCFVGGTDIAATLVKRGHACDWVKFSGGAYSQSDRDRCKEAEEASDPWRRNLEICMSGGADCNYTFLSDEDRAHVLNLEEERGPPAFLWGRAAGGGACDHSWQTASDGSSCGGRAADRRPGGR